MKTDMPSTLLRKIIGKAVRVASGRTADPAGGDASPTPETGAPAAAEENFLQRYARMFGVVEGMTTLDAMLFFMAYSQVASVRRSTLEIGVHHGLSSIAIAALRGPGARFVAIDLFESGQASNVSRSGSGQTGPFLQNMAAAHGAVDFVELIARPSAEVTASELGGGGYSFCHIDGGHSAGETRADLKLCSDIVAPGGLIALDDYFNPNFPGVCEGAIAFWREFPDVLRPTAVGYNKVLFQRLPCAAALNEAFSESFPEIPFTTAVLWGQEVRHLTAGLRPFFVLESSTPKQLVPRSTVRLRATFEPLCPAVHARRGEPAMLPVKVTNLSTVPFRWSDSPMGVSYHLLSRSGRTLVFDNTRNFFRTPLEPGTQQTVELAIDTPLEPGRYQIEVDMVWEGVCWFKNRGNPTALVPLVVS